MKRTFGVVTILLAAAGPVAAGVVITQQDTSPDGTGGKVTVTRTIQIEGSKQRVTGGPGGIVQIIDADSGMMTTLDASSKTAMQMDMTQMGAMISAFMAQANFELKPTGVKKTVAGHACEEYQGSGKAMMGEASVVQCISKDAPGAAEYVAFHKKMMAKMGVEMPAGHPEGVALAVETTSKPSGMAMPGMPPEVAKQLAEQQAKAGPQVSQTEVKSIRTESFPPDTFAIPEDYTKQDMAEMMKKMQGGGR